MRSEGWKAFWMSFVITAAVLVPFVVVTLIMTDIKQEPVASSKGDVVVASPDEDNCVTVLAVVADDPPAFVLVRLDAQHNIFRMAVIPAQSVVKNGQEAMTLEESYAAAGPARAAELLAGTLNISIDRYLAASPTAWAEALSKAGTARIGLSGAMTTDQLAQAGMPGEVREWTASAAHAFLHRLDADENLAFSPLAAGAARAALWQGWGRQKLDQLPGTLPDGLRKVSDGLLTNLTATDLLDLGETLEFLANEGVQPDAQLLTGTWNAAAGRYEFNDDTLAALQALASTAAASGAASGSRVP
jgi:hypothetical protein